MADLYRIKDNVYAKSEEVWKDYLNFPTPQLRVVLNEFERETFLCGATVYTSIRRMLDKDSLHAWGRAADVRLYHKERGIAARSLGAGFHEDQVESLDGAYFQDAMERLRERFGPWKGNDNKEHDTFIIHGDGLDRHIHIQVPGRAWS